MLTVNKRMPRGRGLSNVLVKRAATVELGWDERQKSRIHATDSAGRTLGIFLARGTVLRGGDVLVAEDGSLVRVIAKPQPVMVVTPCAQHGSPFDLVRAAYHLGNRHVALELQPDRLQFEPDPVLADMLRGQHLDVVETTAAFEPEGGAYDEAAAHGHAHHDHGHDHGHDHAQGHDHAPSPAPAAHVHGPGCGHDHHDHGHAHPPADAPQPLVFMPRGKP
jgi:urease accessory protein